MIDYHIHTKYCRHAKGEMEEYVEQALKLKLSAIGFSDHLPFDESHMKDLSMTDAEMAVYMKKIPELEESYGIRIYAGIEADYYPGRQQEIIQRLDRYEFDYVIGSVHYINGWGFDNPVFLTDWEKNDVNVTYEAYFRSLVEMVETGLYDIVAHADLVKKFGYFPERPFDEEIDAAVSAIKKSGMIIEINTSGLRKPVREMYPSEFILKVAHDYDVPVVFGSDAHMPGDVGKDFAQARALLKKIGFTKTAVIEKRRITGWEEI
jgi:histidinol-phosphatase (PHP family)